jgi:hypothetical protein
MGDMPLATLVPNLGTPCTYRMMNALFAEINYINTITSYTRLPVYRSELSIVLKNDDGQEIGNAVADGSEEGDV